MSGRWLRIGSQSENGAKNRKVAFFCWCIFWSTEYDFLSILAATDDRPTYSMWMRMGETNQNVNIRVRVRISGCVAIAISANWMKDLKCLLRVHLYTHIIAVNIIFYLLACKTIFYLLLFIMEITKLMRKFAVDAANAVTTSSDLTWFISEQKKTLQNSTK